MNINLTPDQQAFVQDAIASGRLAREEDAIREALALWETRERARAQLLAEIDTAHASLKDGGGRPITQQTMGELAEDVKRRGRGHVAENHAER